MIKPIESFEITRLGGQRHRQLVNQSRVVETVMAGAWQRGMKWLERTVPLLRRPWPVLLDHQRDPVVTTHTSVRQVAAS
jgi:hypothetical protein